jgi:hypothetical protein
MPDPANTTVPANVIVRIHANVAWKWREAAGRNYVAICDSLKLTLQAPSWTDLMQDISNTMDALLKDLVESNEFEQFIQEHGWQQVSPLPANSADMRFEVPFSLYPLDRAAMNGSQRYLPQ